MLFDDPLNLSPDVVLDWHELLSTGLVEERMRIKAMGSGAVIPTYLTGALTGATPAEVDVHFDDCQTELNLSASLILIASAEARIRHDAERRQQERSNPLGHRLSLIFAANSVTWQVPLYENGIVNEWKLHIHDSFSLIQSAPLLTAIGQFKTILIFRHWIAHGRYWTLNRSISDFAPRKVANVINNLYGTMSTVAARTGVMAFV